MDHDTFLLSCRVIGRGIEDGVLCHIIERARKDGISQVRGEYIKTKKNQPAENFFENFGFKKKEIFGSLIQKTSLKDLSIW